MDLGLKGRVALVCASTGGLGLAVAEALAAEGARVAINGRRAEVAQQLAARLPGAVAVPGDLAADGGASRIAEATVQALGPVDILVLNGGGPPPGAAADLTPAALGSALTTLLTAQLDLVRLVLPAMRATGWGRILALGSSGMETPLPNLAASNTARAALGAYLKTLAAEVAADGVTCNVLLPGRIATDRVAALDAAQAERRAIPVEQVRAQSQATIPAGRYGTPGEFAAVAAFLVSQPAAYVTGSRVRVDGGLIRSI